MKLFVVLAFNGIRDRSCRFRIEIKLIDLFFYSLIIAIIDFVEFDFVEL